MFNFPYENDFRSISAMHSLDAVSTKMLINPSFFALIEQGTDPILRPVMPELDALRGLAILMVILYHGLYWQVDVSQYHGIVRLFLEVMWAGRLGVNLFFVLSGFLITGILIESRNRSDYYRRFYIRRGLRILPVYLVIIFVLAAIKYAPLSFILLSLAYLSNLAPLFGIPISYPVLWSLAVEEHFYFLWPALVRHTRNMTLMISCVAIIIMTPVFRLVSYFLAAHNGFVSYVVNDYTWNSLDGLACGALLSVVLREYNPKRKILLQSSVLLIGIAVLLIVGGFSFGIMSRQGSFGMALQVVPFHFAFTGLVCLSLLVGSSEWQAAVTPWGLQELGKISYGLYLFHLLIFDFYNHFVPATWNSGASTSSIVSLLVRLVVCSGASIGIAHLSRNYFEDKFLRLKNRIS
jgi:peptidoglycan/LPS O-acetylase OafA/YrhL